MCLLTRVSFTGTLLYFGLNEEAEHRVAPSVPFWCYGGKLQVDNLKRQLKTSVDNSTKNWSKSFFSREMSADWLESLEIETSVVSLITKQKSHETVTGTRTKTMSHFWPFVCEYASPLSVLIVRQVITRPYPEQERPHVNAVKSLFQFKNLSSRRQIVWSLKTANGRWTA